MDSSPGSSRSDTPLALSLGLGALGGHGLGGPGLGGPGLGGPGIGGPALGWPGALLALLQRRALHQLLPPPPPYLEDASHRCPACCAAFPSAWLLERHAALQHPPGPDEKPFVCEQCGQSYRYRSAYVKHREQNHRARLPADKLFTCDVCGMQFRYLKSFKKHRLNHALERLHGKGESRSRDSSDHVSSTNDTLLGRSGEMDLSLASYRREPSVTDPEDSDTEFRRRSRSGDVDETDQDDTVDSVVPVNITENVTVESDCEKAEGEHLTKSQSPSAEKAPRKSETSFASVSSMADSSVGDSGAGGSGLQPDSSDKAGRDLTRDGSLLGSSREAAMLGTASSEASLLSYLRADSVDRQRERRFACPFCGKCVRSKENLKLHVRKHTGERPFVCLFCGRAFGGKSDLTRHLRIHTGERPYHCEACGKCFARADYLSKHLTTHIHNPR